MRCPASEKLEIIRLVEQSHLPVKRTLSTLGIPRTTFKRWYARHEALDEAFIKASIKMRLLRPDFRASSYCRNRL